MRNLVWLAAGSMLVMGSGIALGAEGSTDVQGLEEIIVTAEKREESLQKISTSIEVKSGEDLAKQGKKRIDDIMAGTVGIQAQDSQVGVTFFVRGVDSSGGMGGVVSVPVVVDGVVQSRSEAVRGGSLDVSRVEIMRGPQSSTLGVNALAGAVSLVSNKPSFEYEARGSVDIGNYSRRALEGVVNVPLSENQAFRLAYSTEKRDGYISSGAGDSDLTNVRLRYRFKPSDAVDTTFTVSHQNIGGNGVQQGVLLTQGTWVPYTASMGGFTDPMGVSTGCSPALGAPFLTVMGCPVQYVAVASTQNFRQRADAWSDGFLEGAFPNNPFRDTNIDIASMDLSWQTGIGTVSFVPAYQKAHFRSQEPPRGAEFMAEDQRQTTTTLDLRLSSDAGSKFQWQTGAYYSSGRTTVGVFKNIAYPGGMGCAGTSTVNCYSYDLTPEFERKAANMYFNGEYSVTDTLRLIGAYRYNDDEASVLALAGAVDPMTGMASTITGTDAGPDAAQVAAATRVTGSRSWKKGTYRVGVEYDVRPGHMVYGVYNTGYNPGALSGMDTVGTIESTLEQTTLGWKSQFLDNRIQFNIEAFSTAFHNRLFEGTGSVYLGAANTANCQAGPPPPPGGPQLLFTVISNGAGGQCAFLNQNVATVPELVSKGVDMDLTWLVSANDRLTLTLEHLDAGYDSAPLLGAGLLPVSTVTGNFLLTSGGVSRGGTTPLDLATANTVAAQLSNTLTGVVGAQLQNAPKISGTLDYQHVFNLSGGSRFTPRVSAIYKQKYWSFGGAPGANITQILADSGNPNNLAWQQAYTTWDVYGTWEQADGKLSVTAYARNLGNEVVLGNYTGTYVSLQAPRTYGVTFNANF